MMKILQPYKSKACKHSESTMLRVSENGPFQSEKQSTKVKLHASCSNFAWLLHLLQFEPKECELRQPFQPLEAWKVDWEVFVASGKPVLSIRFLTCQTDYIVRC